jgi:hypothetical protein
MPNHCYQSVYIKGPSALVYELYHELNRKEPRFCDAVLPIPFAKSTGMTGYDWRVEHWGTKCDVADVEIDDGGLEFSDEEGPEEVAWFSFKCWTAWSPPIPVWDALQSHGIDVEADYQDEGMMFEGAYQYGENESWVPECKEKA